MPAALAPVSDHGHSDLSTSVLAVVVPIARMASQEANWPSATRDGPCPKRKMHVSVFNGAVMQQASRLREKRRIAQSHLVCSRDTSSGLYLS